jgi:hypothetical protein
MARVAPLAAYLKAAATRWLDRGGRCARRGHARAKRAGSRWNWKLSPERVIQNITLSKAFGVYGGAILGSKKILRQTEAKPGLCRQHAHALAPGFRRSRIAPLAKGTRRVSRPAECKRARSSRPLWAQDWIQSCQIYPVPIMPVHFKTRMANQEAESCPAGRAKILPPLIALSRLTRRRIFSLRHLQRTHAASSWKPGAGPDVRF